ncbi:MAG: class I tRNA ligase family protein, partial [Pseudomonadota bacterium]|nr:class I tRNA ligase family protein [Pseudomonadota bacterium]
MNSQSPYRTVLTHGFVVDADGRKMSKSLGNVISPQSVWNKKGADILRAWTASTDFRNEMSFSEESLERTADAYRRIRNTIRFLMGNLNDFDFQKDKISGDQYSELDKWIVLKTKDLQTEVIKDFENYDIHFAFQKILNFCTNELGGFYLDIIKDRLYTSKRDGSARRSAQSAMHQIYTSLLTLVAPILSFTAEESYLEKNGKGNSIFLSEWFSEWEEFDQKIDQGLWDQLILLKNEVNKEIEEKRNLNEIGSSLEAEVTLVCDDNSYMLLNDLKDELKFLFISSDVILNLKEKSNDNSSPPIGIKISKSSNEKCGRCWHYVENLNDYEEEKICSRCEENIDGSGEIRLFF